MSNRRVISRTWIVLSAVLLAWVPSLRAQESGLVLTLQSEKDSYLVAEPVFVRMELQNKGSAAVSVSPELALETELTSLFIAAPGKDFERYSSGMVGEPSKPLRQLISGAAIEHEQLVLFNWPSRDFAFPAPGRYRLRAVYHRLGVHPDVPSNVIEIEVRAPAGEDARAAELFRRQDVALLVLDIDEPAAAVDSLETLTARFRGTPYADFAQFYLARRESREHLARKPNPARAIELYENLMARRPAFVLGDKAYLSLGALYLERGDRAKAEASIRKALTLAPDQEAKDRSRSLLGKVAAAGKPDA